MAEQEVFQHKYFFSALWHPVSLHCALCICISHQPDFRHQQEYLLSHQEQHSPSINKTTP